MLPGFRGQFSHSIDKKGRVSIPARFREILHSEHDGQLVLSPRAGYLRAYPPVEWEKLEKSLRLLGEFKRAVYEYKRMFTSSGYGCTLDSQGRILIPPELRNRVGLGTKVLFVGMTEFFEIWNRDTFLERYTPTSEMTEAIERELEELAEKRGI